MRLIDADALMGLLKAWQYEAKRLGAEINNRFATAIIAQVNAMPTIEPERKRGEWVQKSKRLVLCTTWWYECSECGSKPPNDRYGHPNHLTAYCPNCGAKMEEGEQE